MQLISVRFFIWIVLTLVIYRVVPEKYRFAVLLCSSIAFYLLVGIFSLFVILIFTLSSYLLALLIERQDGQGSVLSSLEGQKRNRSRAKKKSYPITVAAVLLLVSFWIIIRELSPYSAVGMSFYALRIISYLIDVYRGKIRAQRNLQKYLLFTSFFPLAFLGPVVSYGEVAESLFKGAKPSYDDTLSGAYRISVGVFKKVVIANALSTPLSLIAVEPQRYFGAYTLFLLIFYTVEIYCDFSGGIDICLGASRMLGIDLPENFKRPFASENVREFWNRWHITLGEWFEHYVFYPLSFSKPMQKMSRLCRRRFGSRVGKRLPLYAATLFTWLLTGLWHGSEGHFVAWGLVNGLIVLVSQELSRPTAEFWDKHPRARDSGLRTVFSRVCVFVLIGAVRLLDVYRSAPLTAKMLLSVFYRFDSYTELFSGSIFDLISHETFAVVIAALVILYLPELFGRSVVSPSQKPIAASFFIVSLALCAMLFGTYGIGFDASDFIYSHFNGG